MNEFEHWNERPVVGTPVRVNGEPRTVVCFERRLPDSELFVCVKSYLGQFSIVRAGDLQPVVKEFAE